MNAMEMASQDLLFSRLLSQLCAEQQPGEMGWEEVVLLLLLPLGSSLPECNFVC